jgi:hypothetical protein
MEPEDSLPWQQEPVIGQQPEPEESNLYTLTTSLISTFILIFHLFIRLQRRTFFKISD